MGLLLTPNSSTRCAAFSEFAAAGIAVHAYDAHGHGRSESHRPKDRAYVYSYNHFVRQTSIRFAACETQTRQYGLCRYIVRRLVMLAIALFAALMSVCY